MTKYCNSIWFNLILMCVMTLTLGWACGIPDHLTCLLRNLYADQEATVRTGHGTTDWFQVGKGVCQGCIGEGNGTPLQYFCLENPMGGGAWYVAVHGVAKSQTRLKRLSSSSSSRTFKTFSSIQDDVGNMKEADRAFIPALEKFWVEEKRLVSMNHEEE